MKGIHRGSTAWLSPRGWLRWMPHLLAPRCHDWSNEVIPCNSRLGALHPSWLLLGHVAVHLSVHAKTLLSFLLVSPPWPSFPHSLINLQCIPLLRTVFYSLLLIVVWKDEEWLDVVRCWDLPSRNVKWDTPRTNGLIKPAESIAYSCRSTVAMTLYCKL